jgi:hypothetical protein
MIQYSFLEEFETLDELQSTLQQLKSNPNAPGTAGAMNNSIYGTGKGGKGNNVESSMSSGSGKQNRRQREGSNPNMNTHPAPLVSATSTSALSVSSKTQQHYQYYTQLFIELLEELCKVLTTRITSPGNTSNTITVDTLQQTFRKHRENLADGNMMIGFATAAAAAAAGGNYASDGAMNGPSDKITGFSFESLSSTFKNASKLFAVSKAWREYYPQKMKMHFIISYFMIYVNALRDAYQVSLHSHIRLCIVLLMLVLSLL